MIDNDNKVKELQAAYDEAHGYALKLCEICNEQNLLLQQTAEAMKDQFRLGLICGMSLCCAIISLLSIVKSLIA